MSTESLISYAALILADAELEVSSSNLLSLTKAAGANVESFWADVFAKGLEGKDLKELLFSFAASAPASSAPAAAAAGGATEEAQEEAKEEEAEESDDDMGFGLFD